MNPTPPLSESVDLYDRQRVPAALLLLLELVALGWQSQLWAFSIIAGVLTLSALLLPDWRPKVGFDLQIRLGVGVVLAIYVWHRFLPPEFSYNRNFLGTSPVACSSARSLMALQVLQFMVRRTPDRLPALFCGMGAGAMVFAFDVTARASERAGVQALAVGFVFLSGLFFTASRRPAPNDSGSSHGRRLAVLALLLITGGTAWGASALLQEHERDLEQFVRRLMMMDRNDDASTGFSGRSDLGAVIRRQNEDASAVALRVSSATDVEYLRGAAFDRFDGFSWQSTEKVRQIIEPPGLSDEAEEEVSTVPVDFLLRKNIGGNAGNLQELTIWPGDVPAEVLFAPLNTVVVRVTASLLTYSREAVIRSSGHPPGVPWDIRRPASPIPSDLTEFERNRLLDLPGGLASSPELDGLARRAVAGASTVPEKVAAVTSYLQQNHRYSLSVSPPANAEPLLWFLLNREAAHCEYFATAATVLLRKAGVPVRYVTGFVAAEKNPLTGDWIARNRDAHAWAEAWHAETGWITVEATPADGQPAESESGWFRSLYEGLKGWWQRLQAAIQQEGLVSAVLTLFDGWWEFAAGTIFVVAVSLAGRQAWLNRRHPADAAVTEEPLIGQLHQQLSRMDEAASLAGYQRQTAETLHEFAVRLKSAAAMPGENAVRLTRMAAWYRHYAAVRYGGRREESSVSVLAELLLQSLTDPAAKRTAVSEPASG